MKDVHDTIRTGFVKVETSLKLHDPTATADGHILNVANDSQKWLRNIADRSDATQGVAKMAVEGIENDIVRELAIKEGAYSGEVRSYFLALPKSERMAAAMEAIRQKDAETLGAILLGPTYLSGFSDAERNTLREHYARSHAAPLLARKQAIEKAVAINRTAFEEAMFGLNTLFPPSRLDAIKQRASEARAARLEITN